MQIQTIIHIKNTLLSLPGKYFRHSNVSQESCVKLSGMEIDRRPWGPILEVGECASEAGSLFRRVAFS